MYNAMTESNPPKHPPFELTHRSAKSAAPQNTHNSPPQSHFFLVQEYSMFS